MLGSALPLSKVPQSSCPFFPLGGSEKARFVLVTESLINILWLLTEYGRSGAAF